MRTEDFSFELPEELIAQKPLPRGTSRLLVAAAPPKDNLDGRIDELPEHLREGDVLVVNDTRVIKARLYATNPSTGGKVELLLVEKISGREWFVLAKPGKKFRPGVHLEIARDLTAECLAVEQDGRRRLRFSDEIEPVLDQLGHVPLPPYIRRTDSQDDERNYQTVFAKHPGAVAAPTAGLHFTDSLLDRIRDRGVQIVPVTLHVGIGTFKPVTAEYIDDHVMGTERYEISQETAAAINSAKHDGRRVVAIGTTVVRTLEAAAAQCEGDLSAMAASTSMFIQPGYRFKVVDALVTNFHLPCSTLLMLVSAFAGMETTRRAYQFAIAHRYRFYSYGDAMWVERTESGAT